MIQRNGCGSYRSSKPTYDPADDHHRKRTLARGPGLEGGTETDNDGSQEGRPSPTKTIAQWPRKEDITCPCTQVVDSRNKTLFGSTRTVQELDKAGRNVDGSEDSDVVPSRRWGLSVL